jgi:hypothetical protein
MQNATRPLKLLLDRLAGVRWAPLAAPVDDVVAGPDLQLAAFSPDPFASLQRGAAADQAAVEPGASPRPRKPASRSSATARMPLQFPDAAAARPHAPDVAAPAELPRWRPRPAAPHLPQRARMPWPELPPVRSARGVPALDTAAVQALLGRFAPAGDAPPLDAARLRQLAAPQPASAAPPAAVPSPAPQQRAPKEPAATTPIPRRALPERPMAEPAARVIGWAEAASLPAPQGRASALAELLQRWPGTPAADADEPASAAFRLQPAAAEFTPMPSVPGTPLSAADLPAAFGTELPSPQQVGNDLAFTRTLERVLLAEVRRQGLEPDSP